MTERSVTHATFVIERTYPVAAVARVSCACRQASQEQMVRRSRRMEAWANSRWISASAAASTTAVAARAGPIHSFNAIYQDIVENQRIIYAYDMHIDDRRISVSLATIELKPEGSGTRLTFTEQGAFLDGYDDPGDRERGTRLLLDALGKSLES